MKTDSDPGNRRRTSLSRVIHAIVLLLVLYVLSSGPVLGLGLWLRQATHRDGFYAVMFLYYPLLVMGDGNPVGAYIEWWVVDVFDTVGPG